MIEQAVLMPKLRREDIERSPTFDPRTHLEELTQRYPQAMRVLSIAGVHPLSTEPIRNPYFKDQLVMDGEYFGNAGESCVAVAMVVEVIGGELCRLGLISEELLTASIEAGLVHDVNKKYEKMRQKAAAQGQIDDVYSPGAYETMRPVLLEQGVPPKLVEYMVAAGSETGHNSLRDFLQLRGEEPEIVSGRYREKLVHLADDMVSTPIFGLENWQASQVLTPWERMLASDFPRRYPFLWAEGLGFSREGQIVVLKNVRGTDPTLIAVQSYANYQPFVSNMIAGEFQRLIEPVSKQPAEYFMKDFVNSKLVQ